LPKHRESLYRVPDYSMIMEQKPATIAGQLLSSGTRQRAHFVSVRHVSTLLIGAKYNNHNLLVTEIVVSAQNKENAEHDDSCKNLIYFRVTLGEDIATKLFRLVIFSEFVR